MDILNLQELQKNLEISVKELRKTGTAYAQAEKDYKIKLRYKALLLRDVGTPVTLINQVVYGDEEVAQLRYERDVSEAVYKANQEAINSIKLNMKIVESQISREWSIQK